MLSDEEKKKAEEMALGAFPDFKREDGNTVYCGALRHNFVVGYDAGYNEATKKIKKRFWGLESNAMYGIHYDDTADILFDIHQCIRHQLWEDRPESEKSHITVDAYPPMRVGSEPLAIIQKMM